MKFLHLSDLHLGKRMNDVSLIDDQKYVLAQAVQTAKDEQVDAVIIAGDVYQKASPPAEAMSLFNDFLTALAELQIKVFVISGNHDSALRVSYLSALVRHAGIYISEEFDGRLQQHTVTDRYGTVTVHLLPFIKPIFVKKLFPEEQIETCQDAVAAILRHSPVDTSQRNILVCHQFVTGAETSDSEEHTVGTLDNIDSSLFSDFDYVALGHIHKPQKISRDTLRYCGSPLKYSFSEATHEKSLCIVDMQEKGNITLTCKPLQFLHEVRHVRGTLREILDMPYSEDYVHVTLLDELVSPDARITVATVFPNMMTFAVENSKTSTSEEIIGAETVENKDMLELFRDFYKLRNNGVDPTAEMLEILEEIRTEVRSRETD